MYPHMGYEPQAPYGSVPEQQDTDDAAGGGPQE